MAKKRRRRARSISDRLAAKRFPPEAPCACFGGEPYRCCCGPLHEGAPAPTATALMRSRYAAYALGRVDYVMATTASDSPHRQADPDAWRAALERFGETTEFSGLEILEASDGPGDNEAFVRFRAGLRQGGEDASFEEHSRFVRENGLWRYVEAV